jgi:prepilin-type N-terminal cleavage/methylation domain-containing protein
MRKRFLSRARCAGFSLLEVMVCLVILSIAVPIFLAGIAQNVQLEQMNTETNIALNTANKVVESVHTWGYVNVVYAYIPQHFEASGLGTDGKTVKLTAKGGSTTVGTTTITENAQKNSKSVTVSITWRSITGSNRTVQLITEISKY